MATEDTRLIYMTTGVLLQKVVSAKSLVAFTHIFIDEVRALPSLCSAGSWLTPDGARAGPVQGLWASPEAGLGWNSQGS